MEHPNQCPCWLTGEARHVFPKVLWELDRAGMTGALEHYHWPSGLVYILWDHVILCLCMSVTMFHVRKVGRLSSTVVAPSSPTTLNLVLVIRHLCGSRKNADRILWLGNMMCLSLAAGVMLSQLIAVKFYYHSHPWETEAGRGTADKGPQTRPKSLQVAIEKVEILDILEFFNH